MQNEKKKLSPATIRSIIISSLVILFVIIISMIAFGVSPRSVTNENIDARKKVDADDAEYIAELPEPDVPVLLENMSFLTDLVGDKGATTALNLMSDSIVEYNGKPEDKKSYVGTALSSSLTKGVSFPFSTCDYILSVSNGKNYNIQIASENKWYYGMVIRPMPLSDKDTIKLFIVFNEPAGDYTYKRDSAIERLTRWAKSIHSGPLSIVTKD